MLWKTKAYKKTEAYKEMNIGEVPARLQKLKDDLGVLYRDAELLAAKEVEGAIKYRIFNEGMTSAGFQIGDYRNIKYMNERVRRGRQIWYVDLQMSGTLFGSITTGEFDNKVVCGMTKTMYETGETTGQVANINEARYGVIFSPSEEERKIAKDTMIKFITENLNRIVK